MNTDVFEKNFDKHKQEQNLEHCLDLSRKSSVDAYIQDLISFLNSSQNYFTTSSCSGRFIAFSRDDQNAKKNCKWIYVTHEKMSEDNIRELIEKIDEKKAECNEIHLKFEPFILHVCCRTIEHAKYMLDAAISQGFKNSGLSLGKSKIILAFRSTQNIEVPISSNGQLMVDHVYLKFIANMANDKFDENFSKIDRLFDYLKTKILHPKIQQ